MSQAADRLITDLKGNIVSRFRSMAQLPDGQHVSELLIEPYKLQLIQIVGEQFT